MASYVTMLPPRGGGTGGAGEEALFVRDGFTFWAFVVPLVWFLFHRMWWEALAALVLMLALGFLDDVPSLFWPATGLSLLVSILVGLEAPALRMAALRRRGWRTGAVMEAGNRAEAELRHDDALAVEQRAVAPASPAPRPSSRLVPLPAGAGPASLFDDPGRR